MIDQKDFIIQNLGERTIESPMKGTPITIETGLFKTASCLKAPNRI